MLQLMRNQKFIKALMWIVIIAFVAWLGLELGYGGGPRGANPEVGEVAGESIYWVTHRRQVAELRDFQRRQANVASDEFDIDEQVWQQTVQRTLLRQAIDRMNIIVTPDEVADAMVMNPPQGFEQVPEFQTETGAFNYEAYREFLGTMTDQRWAQITGMTFQEYELQMRYNLQAQKLRQAIESGAWVTDAELRQAYRDQNEKVKLRVIPAPVSLVDDTEIELTDAEVQQYYRSNLSEYAQPERAMLRYVVIRREPSARDSIIARNQAWDIYQQIQQGADFTEMARRYSEDESNADTGGDLGTFARGMMVPPFEEAAFSATPGTITEPVHTRFGWHIIKVERKVTTPADSVEAKHILIRDTTPGFETLDSLQTIAENLTRAEMQFVNRALEYNLPVETTPWFTRDVTFPIPQVAEPLRRLVRWAFVGEVDSIASPHMTDDHIIVAQLAARRSAGPRDLSEVRPQIESKLRMQKKVDAAARMLQPVADRIAQGQPMDAAVLGTDFSVVDVGPFGRSQYLPEVEAGAFDGFTGAAFALARPGQMSGLVRVPERGAYIMTLVERTLNEEGFEAQKEQFRQRLARRHRQTIFADWDRYLTENAEIKDYRDMFYRYN